MAHKLANKPIIAIMLAVVVCILSFSEYAAGQGVGGFVGSSDPRDYSNNRGRQGNYRSDPRADRQQQAEQEMQGTMKALDDTLVSFLQMVNEQGRPTPQQVEESRTIVKKSAKYDKRLSPALRCEVQMLRAWNEYFSDELRKAWSYSKTAYQLSPTNKDAHSTYFAMTLLIDSKPAVKAPPRPRPTRSNSRAGYRGQDSYNRSGHSDYSNAGSSSGGRATVGNILNLDVEAIDLDLIHQRVGPMRLACLNSTTLDYNPAQSNLCLLFWQLASRNASGEPNDLSARRARAQSSNPYGRGGRDAYNDARRYESSSYGGRDSRGYDQGRYRDEYSRGSYSEADYGYSQSQRQSDPFAAQIEAYGRIFASQVINPRVRFLAINTDALSNAEAVVAKLLESPMPWASVMAANPASGAAQYADMDATTPKLAVVDNSGKIRYAGPAEGFLAPMVVNHIAGRVAGPGMNVPTPGGAVPSINPLKNLLFGNRGNTATKAAPAPANQTQPDKGAQDTGEITPESYEAGKLLEYAKMFVSAGRKPILTSKIGVDKCREIIRRFPNTKEAQEARMLLRTVPEREKKRYGITDEELGY